MENKKNKKKSSTEKKGMIAQYKARKTEKNLGNSGLKLAIDLVLGSLLGAGIGKLLGKVSLPAGAVLIGGSHYLGEDTGVLRIAGSAMIAYGIASTHTPPADSVKEKLTEFKDELFSATLLDTVFKAKEVSKEPTVGGIGELDMSDLDAFQQDLDRQAIQYESEQNNFSPSEDSTFSLIDELDLSTI